MSGFVQHCWEALEGSAAGDCPFVGTAEYQVLTAFENATAAVSDLEMAVSDVATADGSE